jgi:hypothetical protein
MKTVALSVLEKIEDQRSAVLWWRERKEEEGCSCFVGYSGIFVILI